MSGASPLPKVASAIEGLDRAALRDAIREEYAAVASEPQRGFHFEFREGVAEALPVPDQWADVVISNGVVNLFPDKLAGLQEMARVLKPGGRLQIGDILVQKPVGESAKRNIDLWKGSIAGALLEAELQATVVAAGFTGVEITWRADVFSGAPQASSAAKFGTMGINFRARRACDEAEWTRELARLNCQV